MSGAIPVVEAQLPAGTYEALLLDPFRLSRIDPDGPRAVDAVLVSDNPASVPIEPEATTQLVLQFRVQGGDVVPAGPGTLVVTVNVDDGPPTGAACSDESAGPCIDELLETALAAAGSGAACVPAQSVSTPLGDLQICEASVCADGSPGCSGDLAIAASAQIVPGGVEMVGSVSLAPPLEVPVRVPALFGGGTCRLGVQVELADMRAALNSSPGSDGRVSLRVGGISAGSPQIDVSVIDGGTVCGPLTSLPVELAASLEPLIAEALTERLSAIVEPLSCTECEQGCALRCTAL